MDKERYANPYVIGALLGLVLLFTFYTMGRGLGSSSTFSRIAVSIVNWVAPGHAKSNPYFSKYLGGPYSPLMAWLVFLTIGAGLGGLFSAFISNRVRGEVARGPSIGVSARLWLALFGGALSGFAAPALLEGAPAARPSQGPLSWHLEAGFSCFVYLQVLMRPPSFLERSGYNGTPV